MFSTIKKGNKMTTKFMFLRDANRNPVACVATDFDKEKNKFSYQYSVVHSNDQFDKKLGKQIAEGRLKTNPIQIVDPSSCKFEISQENEFVAYHTMIRGGKCPKRENKSYFESIVICFTKTNSPTKLKNAAKIWLSQKNRF